MNQRTRMRFYHFCLKLADILKDHDVTFRDVCRDPAMADVVARDMEKDNVPRAEFDILVQYIEIVFVRLRSQKGKDLGPPENRGRRVPPHRNLDQLERIPDGITRARFGKWPID